MNKLIKNSILICLPIFAIIIVGFGLPPDPLFKNSFYFAQLDKNLLLKTTVSPRLILVGGSNISFGVDSKILKDSLKLNPINTGIDARLGLKFMLHNTLPYIKRGDIVVIVPEYNQFYDGFSEGKTELLAMIDVTKTLCKIDLSQFLMILPLAPSYALAKFRKAVSPPTFDNSTIGVYERKSFNSFGDTYIHWSLSKTNVAIIRSVGLTYNPSPLVECIKFAKKARNRGAQVFFSFPAFQDSSYDLNLQKIRHIEMCMHETGIPVIGTAREYRVVDSLTFNTPYHLIRSGVVWRTNILAHELHLKLAKNVLQLNCPHSAGVQVNQ